MGDIMLAQVADRIRHVLDSQSNSLTLDHWGDLFGIESISFVSEVIKRPGNKIQHLQLVNNNIGPKELERLCDGLCSENSVVETLDLASNNLNDPEAVSMLCSVLTRPKNGLTTLKVQHTHLQGVLLNRLIDVLGHAHCRVESLYLDGCSIDSKGIAKLVLAIHSRSLQYRPMHFLSLNRCGLTVSHFHQLLLCLQSTPKPPALQCTKPIQGSPRYPLYAKLLTLNTINESRWLSVTLVLLSCFASARVSAELTSSILVQLPKDIMRMLIYSLPIDDVT